MSWQKSGIAAIYGPTGEVVTLDTWDAAFGLWACRNGAGDTIDAPPSELLFAEYDVPDVGTVIDPLNEPGYRVRLPDGQVTAYHAASGNPCEANAATDIAAAIATGHALDPEDYAP